MGEFPEGDAAVFLLEFVTILALLIVFSGPSALALSPSTYSYMTLSHLLTFIASVVIFVIFGRQLAMHRQRPFWRGVAVGAPTAFAGALVTQYMIRIPPAQRAFISQLHGVPAAAAYGMLKLHVISGTLITGLFAAAFYGLLGGFATWWGSRPFRQPVPPAGEDAHRRTPQQE